jgi:pectate lyase
MPSNANIRTVLRLAPLGLLALVWLGWLSPQEGGEPKEERVASGHLASGTTVTFTSSGDSWVNEASPNSNYGSASRLEVGQSPSERAYLKFNVTGLTGTITSAKLRLHTSTSGSLNGGDVYRSANTTWAENTITWANQPGTIGNKLATVTPVPGNSWHTWDVTAAVAGNGTYSFVVAAQTSDGFILYSEEEATNPSFRPVLEITTVPARTFTSSGDAWVNEASPSTNYGTNSRLEVGLNPGERAYVKFNVTNLNGPVVSAKLKLHTSTSGSVTGGQVYRAANTTWSETGITWSNQPGTTGSALATVEPAPGDTWLSWDVTSAVTGNGTYAFVVTATSSDGFILYSEEEATNPSFRPVLEIRSKECGGDDVVIGWASMNGGTTGGGDATPCVATSTDDFRTKLASNDCPVIEIAANVQGDRTRGNYDRFYIPSNKTLYGRPGVTLTGSLVMDGVRNIIVRDLTIVGYNCAEEPCGDDDATDAVQIVNGSKNIWLHHLAISDGSDGNLDITKESDFITVSWCKFFYSSRTHTHRLSNLIGHAPNHNPDDGKLNVTFHHNWWAQNVHDRMPHATNGKIHVYNNLYTSAGNNNCVRIHNKSNVLAENNVFIDVRNPFYWPIDGDAGILGGGGNIFINVTGRKDETHDGPVFTPPYPYTLQPASTVQAAVQACAGPRR